MKNRNHQPDDLFLKVGDIQYSFKPLNLRTTIQHQTLDQSVSFFGPVFGGDFVWLPALPVITIFCFTHEFGVVF